MLSTSISARVLVTHLTLQHGHVLRPGSVDEKTGRDDDCHPKQTRLVVETSEHGREANTDESKKSAERQANPKKVWIAGLVLCAPAELLRRTDRRRGVLP